MIVGVATAGTLAVAEEQSREVNAAVAGTGMGLAGELSGGSRQKGGPSSRQRV